MKITSFVLLACLVLSCTVHAEGMKLPGRKLLQDSPVTVDSSAVCTAVNGNCEAASEVSTQATNEAVTAIGNGITVAVEAIFDGTPIAEAAFAFGRTVATAYAHIISENTLTVHVDAEEGNACATTSSNAAVTANIIASASARAFAVAENPYIQEARSCFREAVAEISATTVQDISFGVCTDFGFDFIYERLESVAYARAIADVFTFVLAAVNERDAVAAAACGARTRTRSVVRP